jgi:cold shock CspA family protein
MHQKIEQNNSDYIKELFVTEKYFDKPAVVNYKSEIETNDEEFVSTIFSINPSGFGFIKDEERNNIFFHYSRVTNCEFYEMKFGMKVKYTVEEDEERSKKDGAPRYRATKVTVID